MADQFKRGDLQADALLKIVNGSDPNATGVKFNREFPRNEVFGNKTEKEIRNAIKGPESSLPYDEETRQKIIAENRPDLHEMSLAKNDVARGKLRERMQKNYFSFDDDDYLKLDDDQLVRLNFILDELEMADRLASKGNKYARDEYNRYAAYIKSAFKKGR